MNKVLRALVISDFFILSSFGLIQPIFAVFMLRNIGAPLTAVGLAVTIQLLVKAVLQIIVGRWADEERGNKRELFAMAIGSIILCLIPIGFIFARTVSHIYIIQMFYGLAQALTYPTWRVIFTRYLNQDRAGYEWGLYDTVISLGMAATASVGAVLADQLSFNHLFVIVSIASVIGASFLYHVFKVEFAKKSKIHKS